MKGSLKLFLFFLVIAVTISAIDLAYAIEPTARVDTRGEGQLPPYSGPKASTAVAKFDWKAGHDYRHGEPTGLRDMMSTVLVQSKRFRVLERQEMNSIKDEIGLSEEGYTEKQTAKKRGKVKGADLLIVAAITGWDPGTSGTSGGIGIGGWRGLGGIGLGVNKSSMAMDIRIIDTETSEVLAATRVEGEATDFNLGVYGGGIVGHHVGLAGGLSTYSKTPMEKAIRVCIYEAVKYIVENTPEEYFKY
jgi:curli biogenesis system outer membrane secretion channel CsgG